MSVITVQRNLRRQFDVDPPNKNSIKLWHAQLMETGCLCKNKSTGRPSMGGNGISPRYLPCHERRPY
ncbi:hypothetical protein C0J52_17697 [Blattella germanica]|nr:hypothetical protein C0J52_17697 [Blattella germanica]